MKDKKTIDLLLRGIFDKEELILAALSSPIGSKEILKIAIRPLQVKDKAVYQITENHCSQAFHRNVAKKECIDFLSQHLHKFKQTFLYTASCDYHLLAGKKGDFKLLKKPPSRVRQDVLHNRKKEYLLQEGFPIPFLIHLGVMSEEGRVYPAKQDKFRQINRFLEMIDDVLPHLEGVNNLRIVDFGCGKAYLTFALYHFFKNLKGFPVHLTGIDLKSDVIHKCQELAQKLGYESDLSFVLGNIDDYQTEGSVDLVVALHACDMATDAALEKGVRWNAKVILAAPCCQREAYGQVQQNELFPLLKHGILKERFAALATDAARAQLLEALGYQAQILEFIDMEHTPKNLLIRAVKRPQSDGHRKAAWESYLQYKNILQIHLSLERRFQAELERQHLT